jgi:hypothetical protein
MNWACDHVAFEIGAVKSPHSSQLDHKFCPDLILVERAKLAWDRALALGSEHGIATRR